jgi:hypothetical protein
MSRTLPPSPNLRYLKEEAKDLLKAHRRRDGLCCEVLRKLRRFSNSPDAEILSAAIGLQEVQFALALDYGFRDWSHLRRAVAARDHMLERIGYWDRFGPAEGFEHTKQGKVQSLLADADWLGLAEVEQELEPLSKPCREIRRQIANLERCHESYVASVEQLVDMIAQMAPRQILDCGEASDERVAQATAWAKALDDWLGGAGEADAKLLHEARRRLGDRSERKVERVRHLIARLRDNGYWFSPDEEDFTTVESRIQHLEICSYDWEQGLRLVLDEIGAGRQLREWHVPDGFNTCGDCPNRLEQVRPILEDLTAWVRSATGTGGPWASRLGQPTPEKRWLAASLCKHVAVQHRDHDRGGVLPVITLPSSSE